MLGLVIYAKHPDELTTFYSSLLEIERLPLEGDAHVLAGTGMEFHIVRAPEVIAETVHLTVPPAPREGTPLKFSLQVPSVERVTNTAETLGGLTHGDSWSWRSMTLRDLVDPEGNIFQVFERHE